MDAVKHIKSLPKRSKKRTDAIAAASVKFNVPVRTIYHECTKPFSKIGIRKKRKDAGKNRVKITHTETKLFSELIESGFNKSEAKRIIEEKMNKKISDRTKTKIAKKAESEPVKGKDAEVSSFGSEITKFLEKLFKYDKISPNKKIKVRFTKNITVHLRKKALKLIFMIIAGEYNMMQFKEKNKLQYDGDILQIEMIKYQLTEQMQIAFENNSLDDINKISLVLSRLKDNIADYSPNFIAMKKVINAVYDKTLTNNGLLSLLTEHLGEDINNG